MRKEMFEIQMNDFSLYIGVSIDGNILDKKYWPALKKYTDREFAEIVGQLEKDYEYENFRSFPLIATFHKAFNKLYGKPFDNTKEWPETSEKERVEYSKDMQRLIKKYSTGKKNVRKHADIHREMAAKGHVWSYKLNGWYSEEEAKKHGAYKKPQVKYKNYGDSIKTM